MDLNKPAIALLAGLVAVGAVASAQAQNDSKSTKKLYRWVDKDGKVQFSDTLPPEAVDQARTEINADSGMTTGSVERALTDEERAELEARQAAEALAAREAERLRQTEEAMITSFQTEDDLRRSFEVRVSMLKQTLEAVEAGISSQRDSLASLLSNASDAELAGRPVNVKQAETIRQLHADLARQQQVLIVKQAELVELDAELETMVERYRELKKERAERNGASG